MVTITDPMDYVEAAIAEAGHDLDLLEQIRRDLDDLHRGSREALLIALVEEDDRDERECIADYMVMYGEQMVRAHERFVGHLSRQAERQR